MDVFGLRWRLIDDYSRYVRSFVEVADRRMRERVDRELDAGALWPASTREGESPDDVYCRLLHTFGNLKLSAYNTERGAIEVSLQALSTRPPFDDVSLRLAFIEELNRAPGVSIAPTNVSLRPSVPLQVLEDPDALVAIRGALQWFVGRLPGPESQGAEEAKA